MDVDRTRPKIYIVGAGGVGGYFGGLLAQAGHNVTFLARGDHYRALRDEGLRVESVAGGFHLRPVQVVERIADFRDPDLILVMVKTYDTEAIARQLASVVTARTSILTLQTGLGNDRVIARHVPGTAVYPGVVYIISTKTAPGVIVQTAGPRAVYFGDRADPQNPLVKAIETLLRGAGVNATAVADVDREIWTKLVWIVTFSGVTALCRRPIGPIVNDPAGYALARRALDEAFAVAAAAGAGLDAATRQAMIDRLDRYKQVDGHAKTSLLKDLESGRPTEVETLQGAVVRAARRHGVAAPTLEAMYAAIRLGAEGDSPLATVDAPPFGKRTATG